MADDRLHTLLVVDWYNILRPFERILHVIPFRPFLLICLFIAAAVPLDVVAQEKEKEKKHEFILLHPKKFYRKYFPGLEIKRDPPDSTYIKVYPNYLSVSSHLLLPSIHMDILPKDTDAGASKFRTNINDIMGFNVSYRFITAGFAFQLKSGLRHHEDYARSKYRTATIKYTSRSWSFQYRYLRFKGLTDIQSVPYTRRSDIANKEFEFEGLYNPGWKKYSYLSTLNFSQRQVKSRAAFLLKTGMYYTQLFGDAPLIAPEQQPYFSSFDNVNVIRTFSLRLAPGAGANVVFLRRFYANAVFFTSYDLVFYKYLNNPDEKDVKGRQTFAFILDGKASAGYQSKRFYFGARYEAERKYTAMHFIRNRALYTYIGLELGYRFNTPSVVKKFYKETMPPGM